MNKKLKSVLGVFLTLLLIALPLCAVPVFAEGENVRATGECGAGGNNLTWTLTYDGVLTISGSGDMKDYYKSNVSLLGKERAPWYDYRSDIGAIVIETGVSSVGEYAFYGFSRPVTVQLPQSMELVGEYAFETDNAVSAVYYMAPVGQFGSIQIGNYNSKLISAPRHSHVSGGGTSVCNQENLVEPTSSQSGGYDTVERCSYCALILSSTHYTVPYVAPHTHTPGAPVTENIFQGNCTTSGSYDTVIYCTGCGEELSRTHETTQGQHANSTCGVVWVPYTITDDGQPVYDDTGWHHYVIESCSACGAILSKEEHPVRFDAHYVNGMTFTQDQDWSKHVLRFYCPTCGRDYYGETHSNPNESVSLVPWEWSGGNSTLPRVEPTCTEDGYQKYYTHCLRCERLFGMMWQYYQSMGWDLLSAIRCDLTETLPAMGHDPAGAVTENTAAPTCTAPGVYDNIVYCNTCGDELSRTRVTLEATGHANASTVPETEATATEHGYSEGVYCPDCETWLSGHEVIHNTLGERVYLDEYTEDGEQMVRIKCTVCGGEGLYAMEPVPAPEAHENEPPLSGIQKAIRSIMDFFLRLIKWLTSFNK